MSPSDAQLLQRWVSGRDADAFKTLITHYAGLVYGTSSRVLGNSKDAEDITQECFLRLAKTPPEKHRSLGGWLHRVATNLSLDTLRKDASRTQREAAYAERRQVAEEITWNDIEDLVDEAIETLPEDLGQAVVAYYLDGQSHSVIAQEAGITKQAVSYRIKKGIETLRDSLKERGVPIGAAALTSLLSSNAAKAAPMALLATLAKLAMLGISSGAPVQGVRAAAGLARAGKLLAALAAVAALAFLALFSMKGRDAAVQTEHAATPADAAVELQVEGSAESAFVDEPVAQGSPESDESPLASHLFKAEGEGASGDPSDAPSGVVFDTTVGQPVPNVRIRIEPLGARTATVIRADVLPRRGGKLSGILEFMRDDISRSPDAQLDPALFGAHVTLQAAQEQVTTVTADDEGYFQLPDLPSGNYVASVQSSSLISRGMVPVEVESYGVAGIDAGTVFTAVEGQPTTRLVVQVTPYASVSGRAYNVRTRDGISDVGIQALRGTSNPRIQVIEAEVETDALGFFQMAGLRPGAYELVRQEVEGYLGKRSLVQDAVLAAGQPVEDVDFPLSTGGVLTGIVYLGDKPLVDSEFDLMFIHVEDDILKNTTTFAKLVDYPVPTDENGRYVVEGVRGLDGGLAGLLRTESGASRHSELVHATVFEDDVNVADITFAYGSNSLEGFVHSENDRPIARSTIIYYYEKTAGGDFRTMTDKDGRFVLDGLEAGDARIYVWSPVAYDAKIIPFTLNEGEIGQIDVFIASRGVSCSFKNLPENWSQVWVRAYDPDWTLDLEGPVLETFMKNRRHLVASSMMVYERCQLIGLEPGTYTIEVLASPAALEVTWLLTDDETDVLMEQSRTLITTLTIEEGQGNVHLEIDFEQSSSTQDYVRGIVR